MKLRRFTRDYLSGECPKCGATTGRYFWCTNPINVEGLSFKRETIIVACNTCTGQVGEYATVDTPDEEVENT